MNRLLHGILLWNLTTCLEQLFYRTLRNSCFCHLISFRTTLSMIHVKKSMQIYFSKIICGSRTKIYLYIMDLYLCVAESKVQFATRGKWRLKLGNLLFTKQLLLIRCYVRFILHFAIAAEGYIWGNRIILL